MEHKDISIFKAKAEVLLTAIETLIQQYNQIAKEAHRSGVARELFPPLLDAPMALGEECPIEITSGWFK